MATRIPTVLYIEDDDCDRFFMQHAFERAGLGPNLQLVSNGIEAIGYLAGSGAYGDRALHPLPDLVLLDINLPLANGFQVLEWIRYHPAFGDLPVVVFSSSTLDQDRQTALALGANEYWEKPASGLVYREIVEALRERWLSPRAAADPAAAAIKTAASSNLRQSAASAWFGSAHRA